MSKRVPAGGRDDNWRPTAILWRHVRKWARSVGVGARPKGIRAGLDDEVWGLKRQLCAYVEDEVSLKVASVVVNRRTPIEPDVVVARRPTNIEIDIHLGEIAAGWERRAIATPVSIWSGAVLIGPTKAGIPMQPGVPVACGGVDPIGVAAAIHVSGWLTRDVA